MQNPLCLLVKLWRGGYIWVAAAGDLMLLLQAWHRTPGPSIRLHCHPLIHYTVVTCTNNEIGDSDTSAAAAKGPQ